MPLLLPGKRRPGARRGAAQHRRCHCHRELGGTTGAGSQPPSSKIRRVLWKKRHNIISKASLGTRFKKRGEEVISVPNHRPSDPMGCNRLLRSRLSCQTEPGFSLCVAEPAAGVLPAGIGEAGVLLSPAPRSVRPRVAHCAGALPPPAGPGSSHWPKGQTQRPVGKGWVGCLGREVPPREGRLPPGRCHLGAQGSPSAFLGPRSVLRAYPPPTPPPCPGHAPARAGARARRTGHHAGNQNPGLGFLPAGASENLPGTAGLGVLLGGGWRPPVTHAPRSGPCREQDREAAAARQGQRAAQATWWVCEGAPGRHAARSAATGQAQRPRRGLT